jgi:hypothetical protein
MLNWVEKKEELTNIKTNRQARPNQPSRPIANKISSTVNIARYRLIFNRTSHNVIMFVYILIYYYVNIIFVVVISIFIINKKSNASTTTLSLSRQS